MKRIHTYYLSFKIYLSNTETKDCWRIRKTWNDMDTSEGLQAEIADLEKQEGHEFYHLYWRELDCVQDERGMK